jgi:hypothetical protein
MQTATCEPISATSTGNSLVPLDTLGGLAKASIAAGDKSLDKAEQHYKSAGLYLSEAKERVAHTKNLTWPGYLIQHCPIGRRRADFYIEVGEGRTTVAEGRAADAASHQKSRAAAKSAGHPAQSSENHQQKQQQQEENIAAGNNQESAPRKYVNIPPDPRLKLIGKITIKARDASLSELQSVDDFFAKLLSKRKAGSLN